MATNGQCLVLADADGLHDYVFGARELKLIRGASRIQTDLTKTILPGFIHEPEGRLIFAGGGRVLARFQDRDAAARYVSQAEQAFAKETGSGTVTLAVVDYPEGAFPGSLQRAQDVLEAKKAARLHAVANCGNWFFGTCEQCGLAAGCDVAAGRRICEVCLRKRNASDRKSQSRKDLTVPTSFEEIAEGARPDGYLALVYMDMDRLGRFLSENAATEELYGALSRGIDQTVEEAVRGSLEEGYQDGDKAGYEILLIGGDDAIVVMQPQNLRAFVRSVAAKMPEKIAGLKRPGYSLGILIAHHHYPIRDFVDGAGQLMRSAKKRTDEDAVDFAVLTQSMTEDVLAMRGVQKDGAKRTAKPYTIEGFVDLWERLEDLKKTVASSRIRALGRMVWESRMQAELEYGYLMYRSSAEEKKKLKERMPALWKESPDGVPYTEAADLVELWRVVR